MDAPQDPLALSIEERRLLAALEQQTAHDDPKLHASLTTGRPATLAGSQRLRATAEVLCFVAGIALMMATFVQWPAIAVIGLVLQMFGLWALLTRWGPLASKGVQQWIKTRQDKAA